MRNAKKLVNGLEEILSYEQSKGTAGRKTVIVPTEVDVRAVRKHLHLSQHDFAMRYGFPIGTVRNWEQGRRRPEGAARLLLEIIARKPELVDEVLHDASEE